MGVLTTRCLDPEHEGPAHHHNKAGRKYQHRHPECPWDCPETAYVTVVVTEDDVSPVTYCWCGGASDGDICLASPHHKATATGHSGEVKSLYIAGPMSGVADCNHPLFNEAARQLERAGYVVLNPASYANGEHYTDFIRRDLRLLLRCDGVAVLEGWWGSVGARTETMVAGVLEMPVRPWEEWVNRKAVDTEITGKGVAPTG